MTVHRDSTDELCHYTDLGSASECSCHQGNLLQPMRSTTQILVVTHHQYEISTVITPMSLSGKTSGGCFRRLHNIWTFFSSYCKLNFNTMNLYTMQTLLPSDYIKKLPIYIKTIKYSKSDHYSRLYILMTFKKDSPLKFNCSIIISKPWWIF